MMVHVEGLTFAKGHGTANDFVIIPDPDGRLDLTPEQVALLCDRRRGIGGDGLLRVVRTRASGESGDEEWFMDYRNADGSISEMCGNGIRVFARYLVQSGLADGPELPILTRSGPVVARVEGDTIAVDLALPRLGGTSTVRVAGAAYEGTIVDCGNPHLVCPVPDPSTVDAMDLTATPVLDPADFPNGGNVELVAITPGPEPAVRMRVVERGVGETMSCGSGAMAAAAVALAGQGRTEGSATVDVPGGRLRITLGGGRCILAGPAVIVATGTLGPARLPVPVL
jgi:diaminopimelate epimerase